MILRLFAPKEFWDIPKEERGGCGAGDGLGDALVPDSILGLDIKPCCSIHDFMWGIGITHGDFKDSNRVFHNNLYRMIESEGGWLKYARYTIATGYFVMVASPIGSMLYWKDKNKPEEMGMFYNA